MEKGHRDGNRSVVRAKGRLYENNEIYHRSVASGHRVAKANTANPPVHYKLYWYGSGGDILTETDGSGNTTGRCSDALGRLTQVFEPDTNGNFVYETDYQYDVLNNLLRVDQKGNDSNSANWRTRTFTYNSLSQLLTASNPESGTITYTYDDDGNLITKTDARSIVTTHTYDALHRLTGKTYSNGDPAISYFYDQTSYNGLTITNGKGRRTGMSDAAGAEDLELRCDGPRAG